MAEDMIERAAKAIADKWLEKVDDSTVRVGPPVLARAALLAALDPEDAEMLAWISCELSLDEKGEDIAYQVIASLRSMAQGEQS